MPRFGQVLTAMVTPFDKNGELNLDGVRRLAKWLQDNGNDGLVVGGTTGEASTLTDDEKLALFAATVEAVTIPVIAGTVTNDTKHSIHLTAQASKLGIAGILAVGPYYNRPSQAGILAHMKAVCAATTLPVVVYDIPVRTGRKISTATLAKLANEVKNLAALKDASGNPAETAMLMTQVPKSFELLSGDDGLTLPLMAIGATGVIGVATHWTATDHQEMFKKWNSGDISGARAINSRMLESFVFETGDDNPNPLPSKAMMNHLGLDVGEARLPMGPPPSGLAERAAKVFSNLQAARRRAQLMSKPVRIAFLGGLGEIGRNCMAIEQDKKILLIDCGLMFPKAEHGDDIDVIIPDFTWLLERKERIVGCVATHGHEDHVGALQYLLQDASFPLYGSALTLGLARNRIAEARLTDKTKFIEVSDNDRIKIGPFDVEFIPVTHSVPHAHAIALHTAQGVIVHSGDFKIDLTPVDHRRTDLARLGSLSSNEGIRLLMLDSTNAGERGHAPSESEVGAVLRAIFNEHRGKRIITASFASHIHRVQQIADAAIDSGRVVVPLGRSMINNIRLARDLKVLTIAEKSLVSADSLGKYDDHEICIISTGSQGEAMSALTNLAKGDSRYVKVGESDVVIFSSHAIPGNEHNVNKVIDALLRRGATVVHSGIADVHATGHAQAEDLKTYLNVTEPQWFVPIHGEYRHMVANTELAKIMGVAPRNVLLCEDGDLIELTDGGIDFSGRIPAEFVVPQKSRRAGKKSKDQPTKKHKKH